MSCAVTISHIAARHGPRLVSVLLGLAGGGCSDAESEPPTLCAHADNAPRSPETIEEAVALTNALIEANDEPIAVACWIESLERPLSAVAVASEVSLQPALGRRTPRIFLLSGPLVMSILPQGEGSDAVEFGFLTSESRSIKAEIKFPLSEPLDPAAPYDAVLDGERTICSVCHGLEEQVESIDYARAFESLAFRPSPRDLVELGLIQEEYRSCDAEREPERCEMLTALFGHGDVQETEFPQTLTTIFGEK